MRPAQRVTRLRQRAPVAYSATVLADSPLAYWRFEDAYGAATAADSSGNSRALTLNGTRGLKAGSKNSRLGSSINFSSGSGYGSVAAASWFQLTGNMTFECWFMHYAQPAAGEQYAIIQIGANGETEATNVLFQFDYQNTGGTLQLELFHEDNAGVNNTVTFTQTLNVRQWYHLVVTRDASTRIYRIYIDGVLTHTSSAYANNPTGGTTADLNIARYASSSTFGPNSSNYDEVALYNTVLSATRIFEHYRAGRRPYVDPWTYNVLFLRWPGADGATSSLDGSHSGRALTFAGNAQVDTGIQTPNGDPTLLLDGTGDYVTCAQGSNFTIGSNNYTIEAFVRSTSFTNINTILYTRTNTTDNGGWQLVINASTGLLSFVAYNGTTQVVAMTAAAPCTINTWHHVAYTRNGTTHRLYLDGVQVAQATESNTSTGNAFDVHIGRSNGVTTRDFVGNIGPLRITIGTARYGSGNFTIPSAAYPNDDTDPYYASVASLLHFDGANGSSTFTDEKGLVWSNTGSTTISTSQSKFGGSSVQFGNGQRLTSASNAAFGFGTGDFTVEFWIRPTTLGSVYRGIFDCRTATLSNHFNINFNNAAMEVRTAETVRISGGSFSVNTWYHVAISRASGKMRLYVDGVQVGSTYSGNDNLQSSGDGALGCFGPGAVSDSFKFLGFIDDFRITKGVGRYTSQAFTAPATLYAYE